MIALLLAVSAHAFCGFYVSGADGSLYNDATMVVLLRSGTTTVLSMQNNYQGPPSAFAMVVPVPEVLKKENVKVLPRDVFAKVDTLAAPRLVEYWEQDPCHPPVELERRKVLYDMDEEDKMSAGPSGGGLGVKVEARFEVGEYDIVILSAKDSGGLDTWLRQEKYNIPAGAEPALRPYVEAGTKFFVAKVIPDKVQFVDGKAVLSPIRVNYESKDFTLPVRLGLLNSQGQQDLIVHVLAPHQRYELANYDNATIPTNLRVKDDVRNSFGGFYDAVFKEVSRPHTVVTEYAWDAGSCDPCPTPPLDDSTLATLGGDVVKDTSSYDYVLTRLHYRYGKDGLSQDLVFKAADPIEGGRGIPDQNGVMADHGATPSGENNFQGRYVILHPWVGALECKEPRHGQWGGPLTGGTPETASAPSSLTKPRAAAADLVLANVLIDGFGTVAPTPTPPPPVPAPVAPPAPEDEPSRCDTGGGLGGWGALLALVALRRRR